MKTGYLLKWFIEMVIYNLMNGMEYIVDDSFTTGIILHISCSLSISFKISSIHLIDSILNILPIFNIMECLNIK